MVLLRVRSGDLSALFVHEVTPWHADDSRSLLSSVHHLLGDMLPLIDGDRVTTTERFANMFDLVHDGETLDVRCTPAQLGLNSGADVVLRRRMQPGVAPSSVTQPGVAPPTQRSVTPPPPPPPNNNVDSEVDESANIYHVQQGSISHPRVHHLFEDFLERHKLRHLSSFFSAQRVRSMNELCCQTARAVAKILRMDDRSVVAGRGSSSGPLGIEVAAFVLISRAHEEMKVRGMVIDWEQRLRAILQAYHPQKLVQLPSILNARRGDEESVWQSFRNSFEADMVEALRVTAVSGGELPFSGVPLPQEPPLRPTTSSRRIFVCCPRCQESFPVLSSTLSGEQQHLEELRTLSAELSEAREGNRLLAQEFQQSVDKLNERQQDLVAQKNHFENLCREQQQWIEMLESKVKMFHDRSYLLAQPTSSSAAPVAVGAPSSVHPSAVIEQRVTSDGAQSSVPRPAREDRARVRRKLVEFYMKHTPDKLQLVDYVMDQWRGKEDQLERLVAVQPSIARLEHHSNVF